MSAPLSGQPQIDVTPQQWIIIQSVLRAQLPHSLVWAFGSRATGSAKTYSDLDLAVITSEPMSLDDGAALAEAFSESALPWKVDIVDWSTTSERFRQIIERDKVVVQSPAVMKPHQ